MVPGEKGRNSIYNIKLLYCDRIEEFGALLWSQEGGLALCNVYCHKYLV